MAEITLSVSFGLLHALVERVKTSIPTDELAACVAFLDILVVNVGWGPEKQQVQCRSQMTQSTQPAARFAASGLSLIEY